MNVEFKTQDEKEGAKHVEVINKLIADGKGEILKEVIERDPKNGQIISSATLNNSVDIYLRR